MANIKLYGAGRMGRIIGRALHELGHNIAVVEKSQKAWEAIDFPTCEFIMSKADLVFSALPYTENVKVAREAFAANIPYCDLGGSIPVSQQINNFAKQFRVNCMTDVGLAPGLANLMAEFLLKEATRLGGVRVHTVNMFCGGMPQKDNPVHYARTWSMEGLLNEYMDVSTYLSDGEIKKTAGMSLLQDYELSNTFDKFEAFITSGAAHTTLQSMRDKGVANCCYKTVRHKGHAKLFVHFYNSICTDQTEEKGLIAKFYPETTEDMVHVRVEAINEKNEKFVAEANCLSNDKLTAMQQMTAYPAAAIAHMMTTERISSYEDVNFNTFADLVNQLANQRIL